MGDLLGLAPVLPGRGTLVTPQAPNPGFQWGYGGGWAWYRYLGEGKANPADFHRSLDKLEGFLQKLPEHVGFDPGPVVLGGFSQGGTMSLGYAITRPGSVDGVAVMSGFLAGDDVLEKDLGALASTPIFWGHGTQDPMVPHILAEEGRRRLQEAGLGFEARDYPIGHWVVPEEIQDLKAWLGSAVPGWATGE